MAATQLTVTDALLSSLADSLSGRIREGAIPCPEPLKGVQSPGYNIAMSADRELNPKELYEEQTVEEELEWMGEAARRDFLKG
jgi:hypothetical protein